MAGFSSGGSLMPRLIRQHRGRFPPYLIYRTDQRRERPRRKVVQQHGRKRAVVERKLDGDKTYVLWRGCERFPFETRRNFSAFVCRRNLIIGERGLFLFK